MKFIAIALQKNELGSKMTRLIIPLIVALVVSGCVGGPVSE